MKSIIENIKRGMNLASVNIVLKSKSLLFMGLALAGINTGANAQIATYTPPSWWFGVAGAANFNFYQGSTQKLDDNTMVSEPFHAGNGVGLYVAPLIEYHAPATRWGFMLQAGYDGRGGAFAEIKAPCNCPRDLSTKLSYITIEPSLRFAPFKDNFYLYGGPRIAFTMDKSFTYVQKPNPEFPDQSPIADTKGNFSDMNATQISAQIGAGYDIPLSKPGKKTQWVLSPFVAFQPYFGQQPRSIETWNITTLRGGLALKLGCGHKIKVAETPKKIKEVVPVIIEPTVQFTVVAPKNIQYEHRVREIYPLRNYVFFDLGSTEIPGRYIALNKDQANDFKEERGQLFITNSLADRSPQQMNVYYNVINILGNRMEKNPNTKITLVGSSDQGPADGKAMSESTKNYLVNVFGIDPSRIKTEGRNKPKIPSVQPGGTKELDLLREGDRRVSIESSSPVLLMEFPSGAQKPEETVPITEPPVSSYLTFDIGDAAFTTWNLEITDDNGKMQNFGPYSRAKISIPSASILGTRPEGNYKVKMIGETPDGKEIKRDTTVHMVLWTPPIVDNVTRFSVIYEFNDAKAIKMYEKYLVEVVMPKIPKGGTVVIHGFADIIGDNAYNQTLSLARANDVKSILERNLAKAGRHDVKFETTGLGADQSTAPFKNKYPEERAYNRTVIIDIEPAK